MENTHINYIEFKGIDLQAIKAFYIQAFAWEFTDYGPTYTAFTQSGLEGGFELSEGPIVNGVLVVLYHEKLEEIKNRIVASGGQITIDTFSFPGGKRFHFTDPSGNELAVWSDK